jgi:site-specific DNA recombinase
MRQRAALMSRVSSDEQAKGYSLDIQTESLEKYCERYDIEIAYSFREDHSAKNFDRPAFKEFYEYAKKNKGKIDLLLFTSWDRFSRNMEDAYAVIRQLKKLGITVLAIEQPIDLSIPENKLILAMYLTIPEVDNDRRSIKVRGGMRAAMKAGRWCSSAPYGYKNTRDEDNRPLIVPNHQWKDIRWAFEQVSQGIAQSEVIRELNKRGCMIQKTRMSITLRNPVYIGKIAIAADDKEPFQMIEAVHEAIVPEGLFYAVQNVLNGNSSKKRITSSTKSDVLPLRGILKCSKCGGKLTGSRSRGRRGTRYAYYHCNHCGNERYRAESVNDLVSEVLNEFKFKSEIDVVFKKIVEEQLNGGEVQRKARASKVLAAIRKQEERIERLQDSLADGLLSSEDYLSMKGRYSSEHDRLKKEYQVLNGQVGDKRNLLKTAMNRMQQLGDHYQKANATNKLRLLSSIFPEMIEFDGNKCRTPSINQGLALCLNVDRGLRGNKNGKLHDKLEVSRLVARRGIEPLLPG